MPTIRTENDHGNDIVSGDSEASDLNVRPLANGSSQIEPWCTEELREKADLSQAVSDRYRCPDAFLNFALCDLLSSDEEHFRFGSHATCYGYPCSGVCHAQVDSFLGDMLEEVVIDQGQVKLPFDPTRMIDSLRLERYADGDTIWNGSQNWLRKLYCLLRPFMSPALRKQVQRFHARSWRKLSFPHWPVDTTVEDICEKLLLLSMEARGVDRVPFVWFWPGGAGGCVVMTHDVETEAGRDFCADLMDLDDVFGIKASFQIVPEGRYTVSPGFLQTIRDRGFDFGIHDWNHDGRLFDNREEFLRRAAIINRYATEHAARGFRAGLLYRKPEWYDSLNFSFDMSIPNVAHLDPQRGGCCTVMPYFIGNILELPVTTAQDYTLFHLLNDRSIELWKTQIELILEKNGLASFIVHPDYIIDRETRSVYTNLLDHLRSLGENKPIWFGLPAEVDSWWRSRSKMSIEKTGNSWRVVGEGADRAVLAYATNVDGKLVYEIPSLREDRSQAGDAGGSYQYRVSQRSLLKATSLDAHTFSGADEARP